MVFTNKPSELLERIFFLPDYWLRGVDLGFCLLSVGVMAHLYFMKPEFSGALLVWGMTAGITFALWMTNGTARGLTRLRAVMPELLLWVTLRFG